MKKEIGLLILFLFLSSTLLANQNLPFTGIIKATNVNIRAGYHTNFEVLGKLNKNDKVVAIDEKFNWYKIVAPKTVVCYINDKFIKLEKNNFGIVTANRVNLRAKAGTNYSILGQVNRGQLVKIVKKIGSWYEVEPPVGCFVWVHKDYVGYLSPFTKIEEPKIASLEVESSSPILPQVTEEKKALSLTPGEKTEEELEEKSEEKVEAKLEEKPEEEMEQKQEVTQVPEENPEEKPGGKLKQEVTQEIAAVPELIKPQEAPQEPEPPKQLVSEDAVGIIKDLGIVFRRPGTHKLIKDGEVIYYLRGDRTLLNKFIHYKVRVEGDIIDSDSYDHPIIKVKNLEVVNE